MQSEPFKTFDEAKEAEKEYEGKYNQIYARPNPNENFIIFKSKLNPSNF